MYTIHVWDKLSANFDANNFIRKNGTETFYAETENEAITLMFERLSVSAKEQTLITPDGQEMPDDIIFLKMLRLHYPGWGEPSSSQ